MDHLNPSAALRALARRYRQVEDAGFPDALLIIIFAAGGLAGGGVVLLAYLPTHAGLLLAFLLAVAATLAVLLTVTAMVNAKEGESDRSSSVPENGSTTDKAINRPQVRTRLRIAGWRRRHLNARAIVALIVLASLIAPGLVAVIDATL